MASTFAGSAVATSMMLSSMKPIGTVRCLRSTDGSTSAVAPWSTG